MFAARHVILASGLRVPPAYSNIGAEYASATTRSGSFSDTSPAGATPVVAVACLGNTLGAASGFTRTAKYAGASMTSLGVKDCNNSIYGWLELFGLPGAGTGNPETVEVSISSGGTFYAVIAQSVSYRGAASFGTAVTNAGAGNPESASISSAKDKTIVQAFAGVSAGANHTQSGYNQTSRYAKVVNTVISGNSSLTLNIGEAPGDSAVSFSQNVSGAGVYWASVAVPLGS